MNLPFRRQATVQSNPIIPEMNGPVQPVSTGSGVRWGRLIILIVAGLVILAALIAGGTWIYDKAAHNPKTVATSSTSSSSKSKSTPTKKSTSNSGSPSVSVKTATPQSISTKSQSNQSSQTQNQQTAQAANGSLTNTGPGDTIAIFAGATIFGTVLYHLVLRKRVA